MNWIKGKMGKKKATGDTPKTDTQPTETTTPVQGGGDKNVKGGDTAPTQDSNKGSDVELQDSVEYERRLGTYGFSHTKATAAAKAMIDKMTTAMVGDLKEDDDTQKQQLVELYGKDAVDSAGQVGKNFDAILGVLKEGNLRERIDRALQRHVWQLQDLFGYGDQEGALVRA